jgi:2-amino-4-hydroxy-6-hydroxymethyldihydropteridine diphosphokinase
MPVANALIGLGSNLGERLATLESALEQLQKSTDIELYRQSPWLETEPAGGPPNQAPFLNGAAWLKTQLSPEALLARMHEIEHMLGRERQETWGPRTLDLDLLLYDDLVLNTAELQIPHRWLPFRSFVLDPAVVIAPDWVHPILQKSIYDLRVQLRAIPYWFVIGGGSLTTRETLAGQLAEHFQGYRIAPLENDEQLQGKLAMRELPPRGIFISSVDWTMQDSRSEAGLKLQIPAYDSMPATTWELDHGAKAWPLPKARIQLCTNQEVFLTTDLIPRLVPLYQSLSPLPTLNLLEDEPTRMLDQAVTMIAAMTPDH